MRLMPWLLGLLLTGCPNQDLPPPNPPPQPTDDTDQCVPAEKRLLDLGCKDSRGELLGGPNKSGVSFHARCSDTQQNGVFLNPGCLANIRSCEEVDPCLQTQ